MILTHLFRSLKVFAAAALAVVAFSACTESAGEIQEPTTVTTRPGPLAPGHVYRAGFYLTVGELSSSDPSDLMTSRAPAGDYAPGEGIENYIDLDNLNLRVFLFTTANEFLAELTDLNVLPVQDYYSSKLYFIDGSTKADISSGKFKIMVVANWPDYPESDTPDMDSFFRVTFDFDGTHPSRDMPIPMYGIKEINLSKISPDESANLGTIHLIRALAKIEVILDVSDPGWTLSELQLTHYNTSGFCAPAVRSQNDYVKDSWDRDYVGRPFIPATTSRAENISFVDAGNGHYVLYVPEYSNTTPLQPTARIHAKVSYGGMEWAEHLIDIKNGSEPTDLMRNLWYKVTIKKAEEKSELDFTVDVIPYAICDLEPTFGLS